MATPILARKVKLYDIFKVFFMGIRAYLVMITSKLVGYHVALNSYIGQEIE